MTELFGLTVPEIREALRPFQVPAYRARQIAEWMYRKGAGDFFGMLNLPAGLRQALADSFTISRPHLVSQWDSSDRKTTKFLLAFADGVAVEAVRMHQPYGNSVCISTQAGCAMGCAFCASTLHGVRRDLTVGEMTGEVLFIEERLRSVGEKVDSMVLMGSGEPLLNYDSVLAFLRLLHEPYCLDFGYRNITLSTSGIIPGIERLQEEDLPLTLSISLHAPNDEIRSRLMPVNRRYPIRELVAAGKAYAERTKRRVTYEYILIEGINDSEEQARELARLLRGQLASVNLIPINPVAERHLLRPSPEKIQRFEAMLKRHHITATIRREMGSDIQAACGQLRNQYMEQRPDFDETLPAPYNIVKEKD